MSNYLKYSYITFSSILFFPSTIFLQQLSSTRKLEHQIDHGLTGENLLQTDDIAMFQQLQNGDFLLQVLHELVVQVQF
jgi:hypothetical protein